MATDDADRFHYHTRLEGREIRLIQLSLTSGLGINCSLRIQPLRDSVVYDALSYVWGDASNKRTITCNGKQFDVTENLYAALIYVSERRPDNLLWVDAICINQNDAAEKSSQVRMMTEIYAQAEQVICWLGEEEASDRLAYEMAEKIARTFAEPDQVNALSEAPLDPGWVSISKLLTRPWFSRIWVIQEYLVARSTIFVCGGLEISSDILMKAAQQINALPSIAAQFTGSCIREGSLSPRALRNAGDLANMAFAHRHDGDTSLLHLLVSTGLFEATDRRDKVFALMGISSDFPVSMIDYQKTAEEVLLEIANWMLRGTSALYSHLTILSFAVNNPSSQDVPSWVPDWSNQDSVVLPVALAVKPIEVEDDCRFSIESSKILRVKGRIVDRIATIIWPIPYGASIVGVGMDNLVESFTPIHQWHEAASALAFTTDTYPTGMDVHEVFWRTLVADGAGLTASLGPQHRSSYSAWQEVISFWRYGKRRLERTGTLDKVERRVLRALRYLCIGYGILSTLRYKEARTMTKAIFWLLCYILIEFCTACAFVTARYLIPDMMSHAERNLIRQSAKTTHLFESAWARAATGRRFCRTEKGFIGWVTLRVREGDPVVALNGCQIPFTLRRIAEDDSEDEQESAVGRQYKLTGDCFLYGLMQGELLQMEEPEEDIAII